MTVPVRVAVALLLAGGVAACGRPDFSRRFLADRPQPDSLQGRYLLEEQTLVRGSAFAPAVDPEIRLLAEGRFEARGFPLWRHGQDGWSADRQVDATGVWRMIPYGGTWGVSLTAPLGRVAILGRHQGRIQLIFTYGERSPRDAMAFTRR